MNHNTTSGADAAPTPVPAVEHLHIDSSVIDKLGALTAAASAVRNVGDASYILVPEGFELKDVTAALEKVQATPNRKAGTVHLGDLDSFLTFVGVQGAASDCYIYADLDTRTLTAVLNDHRHLADHEQPGWRDFRATYKAELSREATIWLTHDKKLKEQEEFAIFLEDNIADVVPGEGLPTGDTLLAVALTLQAKTEVNFSSHKRLDNGQTQLAYSETIDARAQGGAIEIPREFAVGARLFKGGHGYRIKARLKYRLGSGKVKFWYELDRPENAIEEAFSEYVEQARASGFTVLMGKP
ncbi:Uncharacterized conserved protein YfdQ, DUF2303 family [Janthinobacterium sp. TND4EL3]|jgi:uncharacterized protein YfdQ (DUF2303 family)|uniref:DUF2303 family protein n=1 Tax=Janthinobacterium sp. TND4EL3 TaxID=1907311 RepID=UPI000955D380|nr:DUF2303 family protein [Janthinobacterium sp. TND4EL3]SIQ21064.1 Uncharacterized conserved protein YfdQ, DUF2303 family [Janthinobacterium sp. TND4EL3]